MAVFPGSFDPLTLGHYDIVIRATALFDKVYIALGENTTKPRMFPIDLSLEMIKEVFAGNSKIEVIHYKILTVELCKDLGVSFVVRGIRNISDFEYERSMAEMNHILSPKLETVFLDSRPEYLPISSTIIRELLKNNGDVSAFVPAAVRKFVLKKRE